MEALPESKVILQGHGDKPCVSVFDVISFNDEKFYVNMINECKTLIELSLISYKILDNSFSNKRYRNAFNVKDFIIDIWMFLKFSTKNEYDNDLNLTPCIKYDIQYTEYRKKFRIYRHHIIQEDYNLMSEFSKRLQIFCQILLINKIKLENQYKSYNKIVDLNNRVDKALALIQKKLFTHKIIDELKII